MAGSVPQGSIQLWPRETKGQRDVLPNVSCDELQGFFFVKPMTPDGGDGI